MEKKRRRCFATVIYPESCVPNFKEVIAGWMVQAFLSPLHDKDLNADGTTKKPHYHLLCMFSSLKSDEQIKELINEIKGVGDEKIVSTVGYARYLIHRDNPDKAQYSASDVISFGGIDYLEYISKSCDDLKIIEEMTEFCIVNNVTNIRDLWILINSEGNTEWKRILCLKSTIWFVNLCKAISFKSKEDRRND